MMQMKIISTKNHLSQFSNFDDLLKYIQSELVKCNLDDNKVRSLLTVISTVSNLLTGTKNRTLESQQKTDISIVIEIKDELFHLNFYLIIVSNKLIQDLFRCYSDVINLMNFYDKKEIKKYRKLSLDKNYQHFENSRLNYIWHEFISVLNKKYENEDIEIKLYEKKGLFTLRFPMKMKSHN